MNKKGFSGKNPAVIGNLRISVLSAGLIRLEYAADGVFADEPSLAVQCRDTSFGEFELKQTTRSWELITPMVKLVYYPGYGIEFYSSFDKQNVGQFGSRHCRATGRAVLLDCRQAESIRHEFVRGDSPHYISKGSMPRTGWPFSDR